MDIERWLQRARLRLRSLFLGRRLEREAEDELRDHLDRQIAQHVEAGMTPDAARTVAFRALGGLAQQQEAMRDARCGAPAVNLMRDLRVAARVLFRRPVFSLTAIATIAIGIGTSTAIFAVVNGVLLQPLPFPDPDRVLTLSSAPVERRFGPAPGINERRFTELESGARLLETLAMFGTKAANLTGAVQPVRITLANVTSRFFDVLRVSSRLGRTFSKVDAGSPAVVVIGERLWHTQFAASPDVIGRTLRLDGVSHVVVGVMPAGFSFPDKPIVGHRS